MKNIKYLLVFSLFFPYFLNATNINNIEDYLNNISNFRANFVQLDSYNNLTEGSFVILKPGKFKWDYKNQPIQIISDGKTVIIYDKELKQSSFLDIKDSIASLLSQEHINFNKDVNVIDFKANDDGASITISKPNNKDIKELKLYFKINPMEIIKIDLIDYDNNPISVNFFDISINGKVEKSEFFVKDKRFN